MNLVDILIWVVLLIFAVKGFMKGLIKEVCSLLGLFVGSIAAFVYCRPLSAALQPHIHLPDTVMNILSFGLILLILGLLFFFLGHLLTTLLKIVFLGGANRIGGVFFGALQGAVVLCLVLLLLTSEFIPLKIKSYVEESVTARPFLLCGRGILAWYHSGAESVTDHASDGVPTTLRWACPHDDGALWEG